MKTQNVLCTALTLLVMSSCGIKDKELSEASYRFEVVDSLLIADMGVLSLQDITKDQSRFLFYENKTRDFLITDASGRVVSRFNKSTDGPESYGRFKLSKAIWIGNDRLLITSQHGLFVYDATGNLKRKIQPDFDIFYRFMIPDVYNTQLWGDDRLVIFLHGRYEELGTTLRHQHESRQLELVDLSGGTFQSIVPFPQESKYQSDLLFEDIHKFVTISTQVDNLWVAVANESKIYRYKLDDTEKPTETINLKLSNFVEVAGKKSQEQDRNFDMSKAFSGNLTSIHPLDENKLLVYYREGIEGNLSKELYNKHGGNIGAFVDEAVSLINHRMAYVVNGAVLTEDVKRPSSIYLPQKAFDTSVIWFSAAESEVEKDYNVFYKVRLVEN